MTAGLAHVPPPPLLCVGDLTVSYPSGGAWRPVLDGVSFDLGPSEVVGMVGESGSGKSMTAASLLRMLPAPGKVDGGEVRFGGQDVLTMDGRRLREMRGGGIALVPQNPLAALNPVVRVGDQLEEAMLAHGKFTRKAARARAIELMGLVGIPDPQERLRDHPHQFSGGMRQRLLIAMALSNEPRLIVADEPTTALDVTIQAQVLELLMRINDELGTAILLITHNLGVVASVADRVLVMYAGQIVEEGATATLLTAPRHPYTRALLDAVPRISDSERLHPIPGRAPALHERSRTGCQYAPRCDRAQERCLSDRPTLASGASAATGDGAACWFPVEPGERRQHTVVGSAGRQRATQTATPLLELRNIRKLYSVGGPLARRSESVTAVRDVSLSIGAGETVGLVGESGCGKSTVARLILGLEAPTSGQVLFRGIDMEGAGRRERAEFRRNVQIVFQDPRSSLNPWLNVEQLVTEPLVVQRLGDKRSRRRQAVEVLEKVGLSESDLSRHVSEFSGGQQQRIALARALVLSPSLLVCDEPVSALDVSVQAQVVSLLQDLQAQDGLAYLFVAHDLAVVQAMSHRIAVMYLGSVVEEGVAADIAKAPLHPYTAALYSAVPEPTPGAGDRERIVLRGDVPSPRHLPTGCPFRLRCPVGPLAHPDRTICVSTPPPLVEHTGGRTAACHFAGELAGAAPI
jgi:peptide/nickel transport system ATP-binding protein